LKIIKFDAIDSTNSFLKELAQKSIVENFTIVTTNEQVAGKGQIGTKWISEKGKNLTISIFTKYKNILIENQFYLNFAVSLAIFDTIEDLNVPKLNIKWPNDILSANKKICGILVENSFRNNQLISSVIGVGMNVNQTKFPSDLNNVSSIKNCINKETDLEVLLTNLQMKIIHYVDLFQKKKFDFLKETYLSKLYKKDIPATFKDSNQNYFMGIIKGVSNNGKLQILLEDDSIKEFGIKEISFA